MKKEIKNQTVNGNEVKNQAAAIAPATAAPEPKKVETPEDAAIKEADELQKEIDRKTQELQTKLKELEHKQTLNKQRSIFLRTLDDLAAFTDEIGKEEGFDCNVGKITFFHGQYARETMFSISNTSILKDFVEFTTQKIKERVAALEEELIK
ncbi:MAG: hypothetical protein IKJ42_02300 [Bacteroidaceae bacterium]|nr:hypothetical protein [Bacteroidaceae bacterium]